MIKRILQYNKTLKKGAIEAMIGSERALEKVVEGLKNIFGATAEEVAKAMKDAEYTADEVAKGIRRAYDKSDEAIAYALSYAGYNTSEIISVLADSY